MHFRTLREHRERERETQMEGQGQLQTDPEKRRDPKTRDKERPGCKRKTQEARSLNPHSLAPESRGT